MRMTRLDMRRRRLNIVPVGSSEGSWMMMFETMARVPTANASRYLQQHCKHWSHNLKLAFHAGGRDRCVPEERACTRKFRFYHALLARASWVMHASLIQTVS